VCVRVSVCECVVCVGVVCWTQEQCEQALTSFTASCTFCDRDDAAFSACASADDNNVHVRHQVVVEPVSFQGRTGPALSVCLTLSVCLSVRRT